MIEKIFNYDNLVISDIDCVVTRVKAVIINSKGELLLGHSYNTYQFPGGHLEENEDLNVGLERELKEELGVKHIIYYASEKEILDSIKQSIKIMKTFSAEWICSTVVLLLGIKCAKQNGLKTIASGEGSDDLFGSFPFLINYKGTANELEYIIKERINEISAMTEEVANDQQIDYILPFRNKAVEDIILDMPLTERMKTTQEIKTKYPLRIAYKGLIPDISVIRPQTMAFSGSGVIKILKDEANQISDFEFSDASSRILPFKNKLEYYIFKIYIELFDYVRDSESGCLHCHSHLEKKKINCRVCSTVQYDGKVLDFGS